MSYNTKFDIGWLDGAFGGRAPEVTEKAWTDAARAASARSRAGGKKGGGKGGGAGAGASTPKVGPLQVGQAPHPAGETHASSRAREAANKRRPGEPSDKALGITGGGTTPAGHVKVGDQHFPTSTHNGKTYIHADVTNPFDKSKTMPVRATLASQYLGGEQTHLRYQSTTGASGTSKISSLNPKPAKAWTTEQHHLADDISAHGDAQANVYRAGFDAPAGSSHFTAPSPERARALQQALDAKKQPVSTSAPSTASLPAKVRSQLRPHEADSLEAHLAKTGLVPTGEVSGGTGSSPRPTVRVRDANGQEQVLVRTQRFTKGKGYVTTWAVKKNPQVWD